MTEDVHIEDAGIIELDDKESARITRLIEHAEEDIAAQAGEVRVGFRWGVQQLALVKRAAAVIGVPYQTYLKQAVFEKAVRDLNAFDRTASKG